MTATPTWQDPRPLARHHMPKGREADRSSADALALAREIWTPGRAGSGNLVFDDCAGLGQQAIFNGFSNLHVDAGEYVAAGDAEVGYHISQRATLRGINDRDSPLGPATGRRIDLPVIANLVAGDGRIELARQLCNARALLDQLGLGAGFVAAQTQICPPDWNVLRQAGAPSPALSAADPVSGFDPDAFARDTHHRLWGMADFLVLSTHYARGFRVEGLANRPLAGAEAYEAYARAFRASFPDLRHRVDEVIWMGNRAEGYLSATRWSAEASHTGTGLFGPPSGASVKIWGLTQQEIKGGKVQREFMLMNTFDLMVQIAGQRG